jgi:hypothetical protein
MNINPLDVPGTPFEIELLFPNPSSSRKGYRISFQVSEEVHSAFMSARESNLRLVGYLSVLADTDEQVELKKAKKEKEPKGPYGLLWRELFLAGFVNCPGVKESVESIRETPYEDAWKDLLHRYFGVGGASLATISPEDIYQKFPQSEFPQVYAMVEQARRKITK